MISEIMKHSLAVTKIFKRKQRKNEENVTSSLWIRKLSVNELPDSLLCLVFTYLSAIQRIRIERVCKRWNRLSKCSWNKFHAVDWDIFNGESVSRYLLEPIIIRGGQYLKSLKFSKIPQVLNDRRRLLPAIGKHCPNVERISLICDESVATNSALRSLASGCHKLQSISLLGSLHYIHTPLKYNGSYTRIDNGVGNLLFNNPNLVSLNLYRNNRINGHALRDVPLGLKSLTVSFCDHLNDEVLKALVDRCTDLEVLNLNGCGNYGRNISSDTIEYAINNLKKMSVLNLSGTTQLFRNGATFSSCLLKELDVSFNSRLNDDALNCITRSCPFIAKLDISQNVNITNEGILYLCRLKCLIKLNLNELKIITDDTLIRLANEGRLEVICLESCNLLTEESVTVLASNCLNLKQIDFGDNKNISTQSFLAFDHYVKIYKYNYLHLFGQLNESIIKENNNSYQPMIQLVSDGRLDFQSV